MWQTTYSKYELASTNFQTVARLIRYDFFLKIAKQNKIFDLLVAHNMNDFMETAFMQRKKNSRALFYGIKKNNIYQGVLKIHRPLIKVLKSKLESYCVKNNVSYGIDESNMTNVYQRNVTRKIINTYSPIEFKKFYGWIKKYNAKNTVRAAKINFVYKKWSRTGFNCQKFLKIRSLRRYYVVYNWLTDYGILGSESKISNIIDFIVKGDTNKTYRLEKKAQIIINKNRTMIIEK